MSSSHIIFIAIIIILTTIIVRQKLRQPSQSQRIPLPDQIGLHVSNNDVMQFLKDALSNLKPITESKNIDFNVKCEPESMMGWFDTEVLDRILLLLLSDIVKRVDHGGKINIAAYTNKQYDNINIRISDNGQKISDTGLLITHYMVAFHHGSIRSKYYEQQGNTIDIELPIKKDAYETEQLENNASSAFHIPTNIELHVPTIDIPNGYEAGNNSLREIMQTPPSADQEFLRRAIKCINDNISNGDYDRQTFASDMGCSVSTLYNKIRELTGKNISNFSRDIRIKTACRLAKANPDLRVSDIAYQVGFKDPKYFATSFKRSMGVQPKEYFTQLREKSRETQYESRNAVSPD
jgi:AraC-like DNA-binding protein